MIIMWARGVRMCVVYMTRVTPFHQCDEQKWWFITMNVCFFTDSEREYMEGSSSVCVWVCVWRDFLRDNKEWEWEGKKGKLDDGDN